MMSVVEIIQFPMQSGDEDKSEVCARDAHVDYHLSVSQPAPWFNPHSSRDSSKGNNAARGFYLKRSQGLPEPSIVLYDCLGLTLR